MRGYFPLRWTWPNRNPWPHTRSVLPHDSTVSVIRPSVLSYSWPFGVQHLLGSNLNPGSFLVSVFEKSSLATAITYYFEKQVECTPDGGKVRAAPSLEGIRGTLQACEDQTSAFDWRKLVVAVGTHLGLAESKM
jgi:hypothetical protein